MLAWRQEARLKSVLFLPVPLSEGQNMVMPSPLRVLVTVLLNRQEQTYMPWSATVCCRLGGLQLCVCMIYQAAFYEVSPVLNISWLEAYLNAKLTQASTEAKVEAQSDFQTYEIGYDLNNKKLHQKSVLPF